MIRAPFGNKKYWNEQYEFFTECKDNKLLLLAQPSVNPSYDPEFTFAFARLYIKIILTLYSSGAPVSELSVHFSGLLDAWELSNKLANELKATLEPNQGFDHRHIAIVAVSNDPRAHNDPRSWIFSLSNPNHYNWCFWLVGLALLLEIEEDLWQRLLALVGGEGEDKLLDTVIASRQRDRRIADQILHKKPYGRLLKAIEAPKEKQAQLLFEFVDNWYKELYKKKGNDQIWWCFQDRTIEKLLEMGNYFGYWCIEAAVAVKVFDLDDSLCLTHEHYPKALIHDETINEDCQAKELNNTFTSKLFGLFKKRGD